MLYVLCYETTLFYIYTSFCFISTCITARAMLKLNNSLVARKHKYHNTTMPLMLTDFLKYVTDITFSQS